MRIKKECKEEELGYMNPWKVINCMNEIQKEDHPEAYEPEIVRVYNKKREDE